MKEPVYLSVPVTDPDLGKGLRQAFAEAGIATLGRDDAPPGQTWPKALSELLGRAGTLVVILSPGGLDRLQIREREIIASGSLSGDRLPTVLVLPPDCHPLTALDYPRPWVILADPGHPGSLPAEVAKALQARVQDPTGHPPGPADVCPYPGLAGFTESENGLYFGRRREVERLATLVRDHPLTLLSGLPGSGRRSLVHAGLFPLMGMANPAGPWERVELRPTAGPFQALAATLLPLLHPELRGSGLRAAIDDIGNRLDSGALTLETLIQQLLTVQSGSVGVLLHLDGLEWLTLASGTDTARRFLSALEQACSRSPLKVIATLATPEQAPLLDLQPDLARSAAWMIPASFTPEELRQVITGPATLAGLPVDEILIDRLVDDAAEHSGHPGRIACTLRETWRRRTRSTLSIEAYHAAGCLENSLEQRADNAWRDLDPEQQRQSRTQWLQILESHGGPTKATDNDWLSQAWSQGRLWNEQQIGFSAWRHTIAGKVSAWNDDDDAPAQLLKGVAQLEAQVWMERRGDDLSASELAFIHAGNRTGKQAGNQYAGKDRRASSRPARGPASARSPRKRGRETALGIALGLAITALGITSSQWWLASQRFTAAPAMAFNDETPAPPVSTPISAPAPSAMPLPSPSTVATNSSAPATTPAPRSSMALVVPGDRVSSLSFSSDGRLLLTGSSNGSINLWDTAQGTSRQQVHTGERAISAVHFLDHDRQFAAVAKDASVHIWSIPARRPKTIHAANNKILTGVGFDADGTRVAIADSSDNVSVYALADGHRLLQMDTHTSEVITLAFSPSGEQIASADEGGGLWLWDGIAYQPITRLLGHRSFVDILAFDPQGRQLLSAGGDGHVRIWRAADGALIHDLEAGDGRIYNAVFSSDGTQLASADGSGSIRLWDTGTGTEIRRLDGHTGAVRALAFSPDGHWLASAGNDHSLRLWPLPDGRSLLLKQRHTSRFSKVRFDPSGQWLAASGETSSLLLWYLPAITQTGHSPDAQR